MGMKQSTKETVQVSVFREKDLDGLVDVILSIQQKEFNIPITLED